MSEAPGTYERLVADVKRTAAAIGCCCNPAWRGRPCQYHEGMIDGIEKALAERP